MDTLEVTSLNEQQLECLIKKYNEKTGLSLRFVSPSGYSLPECGKVGYSGIVFKVTDTIREKYYALKILDPVYSAKKSSINSFNANANIEIFKDDAKMEIELSQEITRMRNPNLMPFYYNFTQPFYIDNNNNRPIYCLLMPWLTTLNDWVTQQNNKLNKTKIYSEEITRRVANDLCVALETMHNINKVGNCEDSIIHRDIKIDNIYVDCSINGETFILGDFSISRKLSHNNNSCNDKVDTPIFSAPEMSMGNYQFDARTDIFSLGMILYYMLCKGSQENRMEECRKLHNAIIQNDRKLSKFAPKNCTDEFWNIILTMIKLDPSLRFNNIGEVLLSINNLPAPDERLNKQKKRYTITLGSFSTLLVLFIVIIFSPNLVKCREYIQYICRIEKTITCNDSIFLGSYTGTILNGQRNGKGVFIWDDIGCSYSGDWKDGYPYGNGIYYCSDGTKISGDNWDYANSITSSKKKYDRTSLHLEEIGCETNYTYSGMTLDNTRTGYGCLISNYSDNKYIDITTGEWLNNCKNGQSTIEYFDLDSIGNKFIKSKRIENYKNDTPINGKYISYGDNTYIQDGNFTSSDNFVEQECTISYLDGSYFKGTYCSADYKEGVYKWPSGAKLECNFLGYGFDNTWLDIKGYGTYTYIDGHIVMGLWSYVKKESQNITLSNGDELFYTGIKMDNKKCGYGKLYYINKYDNTEKERILYEGEFFDDKFEGKGYYDGYLYEELETNLSPLASFNIQSDFIGNLELKDIFLPLHSPKKSGSLEKYPVPGGLGFFYDGNFKNGMFNGEGTLSIGDNSFINSFTICTMWIDGKPQGTSVLSDCYFTNHYSVGNWDWVENMNLHLDEDGNVSGTYTGWLLNNTICGLGKISWADGSEYFGCLYQGRYYGYGILNYRNTDFSSRVWDNGNYADTPITPLYELLAK